MLQTGYEQNTESEFYAFDPYIIALVNSAQPRS